MVEFSHNKPKTHSQLVARRTCSQVPCALVHGSPVREALGHQQWKLLSQGTVYACCSSGILDLLLSACAAYGGLEVDGLGLEAALPMFPWSLQEQPASDQQASLCCMACGAAGVSRPVIASGTTGHLGRPLGSGAGLCWSLS